MKNEKGFMLIEVVVSVGLLSLLFTAVLCSVSTASMALSVAGEQTAARNLAESQLQTIRKQPYAVSYTPVAIPAEYAGYSATVEILPITSRDGNLQKIQVSVSHQGNEIIVLENYRVNR